MNKTTTTRHIIRVTSDQLKRRFYEGQMNILQDELQEGDTNFFEKGIKNLHDDIQTIENKGFRSVFLDGYTMVVLSPEEFDFVDSFFSKKKPDEELIIAVLRNGSIIEEIHHSDLSY
jgi:hypothetical protein